MRAMESADSALTTTMQNSADDRLKRLEWTDLLCQRLHDYQAKSTSLRKNGRKKKKEKKEKKQRNTKQTDDIKASRLSSTGFL